MNFCLSILLKLKFNEVPTYKKYLLKNNKSRMFKKISFSYYYTNFNLFNAKITQVQKYATFVNSKIGKKFSKLSYFIGK